MLFHDLQLAALSCKRTPILTALMLAAIAAGIGACMVTVTIYHSLSVNPIWWKKDRLYAVTVDSKSVDPKEQWEGDPHPEYPPLQLTYQDAKALFASDIPLRKVRMYRSGQTLEPSRPGVKPFGVSLRVTTADFFAMFDVPFKFGGGWTAQADAGPDPVVVLSKRTNNKIFGGENSVGRTISLDGRQYRVVGVLDAWMPTPKFYDLNTGAVSLPEDVYLPFLWGETLELPPHGNFNCMNAKAMKFKTFKETLNVDCIWLQFWAEFSNAAQRARFQQFVDAYVMDQKKMGRLPRPLNNRIVDVPTWLQMYNVVGNDNRALVALAAMFLVICLLNTSGLMLAKFLGAAPIAGLRRALGASRRDIVRQHLTEVVALSVVGGLLGIGVSFLGLWVMRSFSLSQFLAYDNNPDAVTLIENSTRFDGTMLWVALGLSLLAGLIAGLYPALRISRVAPATYLKTQ